jgi:hypothetical protein
MHDQPHLTEDAILRMQIAMATRLIAEQSAAVARAHSAIERAMQNLRLSDDEGAMLRRTFGNGVKEC